MQPNYSVSLPHYSVGPEAYSLVGDVIRPYGTRVAVVGGETAMTKANPSLLPAPSRTSTSTVMTPRSPTSRRSRPAPASGMPT